MYIYVCIHVCTHIYVLEVGGGESVCETASREIVSFRSCVRASERARDQRFDCEARAVVRPVYLLSFGGETMPGGLSTKNVDFNKVLYGFSRTTLVKPM